MDYEQDYYPEYNEPYFLKDDTGFGTCPECGSFLENWGAISQGDGDLYDALGCPNCQEERGQHNLMWFVDDDFWDDDDFIASQYPEGGFE